MGLSIQNQDVKSKEELATRGAPPSNLIHDRKIWVTANDILKPLDQAIEDGDVGAEVGVGSAFRQRSIAYGDGSTEELGLLQPPYINDDGDTVLETDYGFTPEEFIRVFVDREEWIEYISEAVTPDFYWYREGSNKIIIKGDQTQAGKRLEIQVMDGVNLPPILSSLYAGMDLIGDSYGYTDGSNGSSGVNSIYVQSSKTHIELSNNFTKEDYIFVYVNNEFYLPFKNGITSSKYYERLDNNTIILDGDYSTQSFSFYIAIFRGKFLQDDLGNVIFEIGATIKEYALTSPDSTVWGISATDNGEIVAESGSTAIPEPIRFRRDDDTIIELEISDEGQYTVNENPTPGVVFESILLVSPSGVVWGFGVNLQNQIYLESDDLSSNKFSIRDTQEKVVHEVQNTPDGAIFKLKHFYKGKLPKDPDLVTQNTLLAIEQDGTNEKPRLMQYNTFSQKWQAVSGGAQNVPVGEVKTSVLPPAQFKNKYGEDWEIMDGSVQLNEVDYPELSEIVPQWIENGVITIPDHTDYQMEAQRERVSRNQRVEAPEGFNVASDLWAGITSIRRMYWAGQVDGNDTTINDFNIDYAQNAVYCDVRNSEQRAGALAQLLVMYRKKRIENRYIKVK